jgi:hypothetical protein
VNSTIRSPKEILVAFIESTFLCKFRSWEHFPISTAGCWTTTRGAQIGFGPFARTSTANTVAVLRTLPAIVRSASDKGVCCSANPSSRVLTLWSWSTSRKIAAKGIGKPLH